MKNKVYLHVGNSGVTFSVVDRGDGPEVKISSSAFGNLISEFAVKTDVQSLAELAKMFEKAANYDGYSRNYCQRAYLVNKCSGSSVTLDKE